MTRRLFATPKANRRRALRLLRMSTRSGRRHAAVDFEHRARNIGGFRGRNEHDCVGNFLRSSPAEHRNLRDQRFITFGGTSEAVEHDGVDWTWPDCIYANA